MISDKSQKLSFSGCVLFLEFCSYITLRTVNALMAAWHSGQSIGLRKGRSGFESRQDVRFFREKQSNAVVHIYLICIHCVIF
jgi:hypothetical protein